MFIIDIEIISFYHTNSQKPAAVSSRPASFIDTEAGLEKLCELLK